MSLQAVNQAEPSEKKLKASNEIDKNKGRGKKKESEVIKKIDQFVWAAIDELRSPIRRRKTRPLITNHNPSSVSSSRWR